MLTVVSGLMKLIERLRLQQRVLLNFKPHPHRVLILITRDHLTTDPPSPHLCCTSPQIHPTSPQIHPTSPAPHHRSNRHLTTNFTAAINSNLAYRKPTPALKKLIVTAKIVVSSSGSVVRCSKDCGEVVNNWLANLRWLLACHVKAGLKGMN